MKRQIEIVIENKNWLARRRGLVRELEHAARLALTRGGCRRRVVSVSILLAGDSRLKKLNAKFRRKKKPTNVLSFGTGGAGEHLGDLALAYGVSAREARAQGKTLAAHATHLVVHGVLHLLGFDHQTTRAAARMEPLETAILAELGIPDPYTARAKAA